MSKTHIAVATPFVVLTLIVTVWGAATPARANQIVAPLAQKIVVDKVTFAKALGKNQEPVNPTDKFEPTQPVHLSVAFRGRPLGIVTCRFYFRDALISEARVDMGTINKGVVLGMGQNTFVGFTLAPNKGKSFPISDVSYHADAYLDGQPLGSYRFKIVPPANALATEVTDAMLARGATGNYEPIDPATEFAPDQPVYLVGAGDFGQYSWLQADWYTSGKLLDAGTRSITMQKNQKNAGFSFFFLPDGGWKAGEHEVVLTVNDKEVGRYPFAIESLSTLPGEEVIPAMALEPVALGALTTYKYPRGLFSILSPSKWKQQDNSTNSEADVRWDAPMGNAFIAVNVLSLKGKVSAKVLVETGKEFLTQMYGDEPGFNIQNTRELEGNLVGIGWVAEPKMGGQRFKLGAATFVRQDGDKLSIVTFAVPADQFKNHAEQLQTIVESLTVDPKAKF